MFAPLTGTIDQTLARERAACWSELGEIAVREARDKHRAMELARQANARGDWKAAGYASHEEWYAQASRTDHRTAKLVTETSEALAELPRLDEAVSTGKLTLDQVAAAAPFATPETDAEITRVAVGKAPREIARVARTLAPPKIADDRELYRRRKLSMAWTNGKRELVVHARLPLEQGLAFENAVRDAAKEQRALDKKDGVVLEWQQSAADALVTLVQSSGASRAGSKRAPAMLIVHISEDAPAMLEGAGPISAETAERLTCGQPRLFIKRQGDDISYSREGRVASFAQKRFMHHRSPHYQYPGCTSTRDLEAHHITAWARGGKTRVGRMMLLCGRHHDRIHEYGIRTSGTGENPIFTGPDGRLITANQPHAPPS